MKDNASSKMKDLVIASNKFDATGSGRSKEELRRPVSGQNCLAVSKNNFFDEKKDKNDTIDFAAHLLSMEHIQILTDGKERRISSILKVSTQKDSLSSCDRPKLHQNELSISTSRSSRRLGSSGNLDESQPKVAQQRPVVVNFLNVEVREYSVVASHNPGGTEGVPLELGWDYNVLKRMHLDAFEDRRFMERAMDFKKEKRLTRKHRENILREFGATKKDIQAASKRAAVIRNKRKKSIAKRRLDKFHESVENHTSSIKSWFNKGRAKSKPKKMDIAYLKGLHRALMAMIDVDDKQKCQ